MVVVVVVYLPNTNRQQIHAKLNGIKHIWQVAREALVVSQLATYS